MKILNIIYIKYNLRIFKNKLNRNINDLKIIKILIFLQNKNLIINFKLF